MEIIETFATSTQGEVFHDSPKTLGVIDTSLFEPFLTRWEALCAAMKAILDADNDPDFVAALIRARTGTTSFTGMLDPPGTTNTLSAMDIGSFLQTLFTMCQPTAGSQLASLLDDTYTAYLEMFVEFQRGPTTPGGTGMHISWVVKQEYLGPYFEYYQPQVFPEGSDPFVTDAPNYFAFLDAYYKTKSPSGNAVSVCQTSSQPSRLAVDEKELLIDPDIHFPGLNVEFKSEITRNVDYVFVEYGYDVSHLMDERRRSLSSLFKKKVDRRRRRLQEARGDNDDVDDGTTTAMKYQKMNRGGHSRKSARRSRRRAQEIVDANEDYFYIFGGDSFVHYSGPNVNATWDRNYYWLGECK